MCWCAVRYPVVNEQRDGGVRSDGRCLAGGGVRGHDDDGVGVVGRRGKVGVIHQGYVRNIVRACCEVKLVYALAVALNITAQATYEASIFQTLYNFLW